VFDADAAPSLPTALDRVWSRRALWLRTDVLVAVAAAVALVVATLLWWRPGASAGPPPRPEAALPLAAPVTPSSVVDEVHVHAASAVVRPGLYRLPAGARVADLLDAAGGVELDAEVDRINLAAPLVDGAQLLVPRRGEPGGGLAGPGADAGGGPSGPIDLNLAGVGELETLPGVGPATAAAIVAHREAEGAFGSVDDLLEVRGIGPAKLDAVRDLVSVG
jgi:competence protein ComEA